MASGESWGRLARARLTVAGYRIVIDQDADHAVGPGHAHELVLGVLCVAQNVTVQRRLAALVSAPLLGIAHLSEFDTHEHPLETVIGCSYQSSTLTQFLGHLERIEAAETLMPLLLPSKTAEITYVDGGFSLLA